MSGTPSAAGRAALRAELQARGPASLRPAALGGAGPLRPLPGALLGKLEVRARAGYEPEGPDHPRADRVQQAALPEMVLGLAAAVGVVVGVVARIDLLALVAGALLAACVLAAAGVWSWVCADPLRLGPGERRVLGAAGVWQASQPWPPQFAARPERALVSAAVDVVREIAASPVWRSGYLDGHRLELDLAAELDELDAQALQAARLAQSGAGDAATALARAAFDACLDRVLALRAYAARLAVLGEHLASADAQIHAAPRLGELSAARAGAEVAIEQVRRLTEELDVITAAVDRTAEDVRKQRE